MLRLALETIPSAGILTSCPSAAAFAIALGPTNPWMIVIAKETLGLRRSGISPDLRLLVPTFSLPCTPVPLAGEPSLRRKCSPTTYYCRSNNTSVTSVPRLAPINFWRKDSRRVSCYALFKGWLLLSQPPRCMRIFTTFYT